MTACSFSRQFKTMLLMTKFRKGFSNRIVWCSIQYFPNLWYFSGTFRNKLICQINTLLKVDKVDKVSGEVRSNTCRKIYKTGSILSKPGDLTGQDIYRYTNKKMKTMENLSRVCKSAITCSAAFALPWYIIETSLTLFGQVCYQK